MPRIYVRSGWQHSDRSRATLHAAAHRFTESCHRRREDHRTVAGAESRRVLATSSMLARPNLVVTVRVYYFSFFVIPLVIGFYPDARREGALPSPPSHDEKSKNYRAASALVVSLCNVYQSVRYLFTDS